LPHLKQVGGRELVEKVDAREVADAADQHSPGGGRAENFPVMENQS